MKKSDLVLAQKAHAARQVKVESKVSKKILKIAKAEKLNRAVMNKHNNSGLSLNSSMDSSIGSLDSQDSTRMLPIIRSPVNQSKPNPMRSYQPAVQEEDDDEFSVIDMIALQSSAIGTELVNELSYRSSTAKTSFRKMQAQVQKEMKEKGGKGALGRSLPMNLSGEAGQRTQSSRLGSRVESRRNSRAGSRAGSRAQTARSDMQFDDMFANQTGNGTGGGGGGGGGGRERDPNDDNYFMPKVRLLRPDGASLLEVYNSKREDTWCKILKAQLRDDEVEKARKKHEREEYEEEFGSMVKKQIEDNKSRNNVDAEINEKLAALSYETSKKYEDLQKQRTEDARRRHQEFISNAVEDIETKRVQREKDLIEEITSATIMVNKAKSAIEQEAKAKEHSKVYHKNYQEAVYQDNIVRLARKEKEKHDDWADTKRIISQKDAMDEKEQSRRKIENDARMFKSAEGPAHKIVDAINKRKKVNTDKFYQDLVNKGDTLNKTLLKSEDEANKRGSEVGKGLQSANLEVILTKQIRAKEEEEYNKRILATMADMLKGQELQVLKEKEVKRQSGLKYQQDLDRQVSVIRQRSLDSMTKTMTDEEMRMNLALIRKTGVHSISVKGH